MADMGKYDYVRFALCDIHGRSRGCMVPVRFAKKLLQNGSPMYGGTVLFGPNNEKVPMFSDDHLIRYIPRGLAMPDADTFHNVPWTGGSKFKVVEVLCESYWLKDHSHQLACPRYVARQQLQKLQDMGYDLFSSFEIEFMLSHPTTQKHPKYMDHILFSRHSDFLLDLEHQMSKAGVDIEGMHSEYAVCMFEAIMKPKYNVKSADQAFVFKTGVLELADKSTYEVQFHSEEKNTTVGMHFNHSLWSKTEKRNVFQDLSDPDGFSEISRHWIAGLMKHSRALAALWCPTADDYARIQKMFHSASVSWDFVDRMGTFIAKTSISDTGPYVENRIPCGVSNPYLTLAATVAAGIDGILKKIDCSPPRTECGRLPDSLPEAVQELRADVDMVKSLGPDFVEWFAASVLHDLQEDE